MKISFKAKIIIFALSLIIIPAAILVIFFMTNFNSVTNFSLEQNKENITASTKEYLTNFVTQEADLIYKDLEKAISNIIALGKSTQKVIDNYEHFVKLEDIYKIPLLDDNIIEYKGALTNPPTEEESNILIPPSIADEERSKELLRVSSLLNLFLEPLFKSDKNNSMLYFVADKENPVTRAYPNINLAKILEQGGVLDFLFWADSEQSFFSENVEYWSKFYTNEDFRKKIMNNVGNRVTVEPPYEDAAGQGTTITMFYPLWNTNRDRFGGVIGLDMTLNNMIENILSIKVAETGYAFLMNGEGKIIAMPEKGYESLKVDLEEIQVGGLSYYTGSLESSSDKGVQKVYSDILNKDDGFNTIELDNGEKHIMAHSTLPPINDKQYNPDSWKIVITVPQNEVLTRLF
ncbi:MAG: hypothetical protein ACOCV8_02140, partial [Spirochaetota bacterium]